MNPRLASSTRTAGQGSQSTRRKPRSRLFWPTVRFNVPPGQRKLRLTTPHMREVLELRHGATPRLEAFALLLREAHGRLGYARSLARTRAQAKGLTFNGARWDREVRRLLRRHQIVPGEPSGDESEEEYPRPWPSGQGDDDDESQEWS